VLAALLQDHHQSGCFWAGADLGRCGTDGSVRNPEIGSQRGESPSLRRRPCRGCARRSMAMYRGWRPTRTSMELELSPEHVQHQRDAAWPGSGRCERVWPSRTWTWPRRNLTSAVGVRVRVHKAFATCCGGRRDSDSRSACGDARQAIEAARISTPPGKCRSKTS